MNQSGRGVLLQTVWRVGERSPALTDEAITRLAGYVPRYGGTLGLTVHAVGGTGDHLHLLHDLPTSKTLVSVMEEIRRASVRFLRDSLNLPAFAWSDDTCLDSFRASDRESLVGYVRENAARHAANRTVPEWECGGEDEESAALDADEMPEWLKQAAARTSGT